MTYDQHGVEDASRALLEAVGEDITREGLRDTPSRMGRAWRELLSGLEEDPRDHLKTTFEVGDGRDRHGPRYPLLFRV